MNILINTSEFKNSLHEVMGVVNKDMSMPILGHVLIEKEDKNIKITGTNLEVQISSSATFLEADEFDPVTVSGRKLYDIVRALDNQELQIKLSNNKLLLNTTNSSFKLSTLPSNSFPQFDDFKAIETFAVNQNELLDLMNKTSFSMATNPDVRFILCGLLLEISSNSITAVATDAHRLAISSLKIEKSNINNISCIIPRKAVLELIRVLQGNKEAKVSIGNNQISVDTKGLSFVSKLMDGKFPAGYKKVIPVTATIDILLQKQNIRSALQRVSILANEKFKGVRLEATNKAVVLSSENPEQEEATETIEYGGQSTDSNKITAGFNASYLIEAINACSGDDVVIGLNGPIERDQASTEKKQKTEGTLIFSPSDKNTKYVVMPYNI
ncbi:MAG: DNA polymerase III subunit beta [Gammaproteobacteria bacterium]|nr:DNA polymerase III subunit beta [Gammaproteobacteria bacterium]|tara:strand:+ start:4073 stop:5224 length:1152 start_codon:yes stop_codon:yes gene_type:complete